MHAIEESNEEEEVKFEQPFDADIADTAQKKPLEPHHMPIREATSQSFPRQQQIEAVNRPSS